MSTPSFSSGAMRGAVDLSSLGQTPVTSAATSAGAGAAVPGGLRVEGTEANFQELVLNTRNVVALFVLYSAAHPESEAAVEQAVAAASTQDGRVQVVAVDTDANPKIAAAFQVQQLPMTLGVIAGQPIPLFPGVQPAQQITAVLGELLTIAAQNGVTGRIEVGTGAGNAAEPELPPLHQKAYEAIEAGDFPTAREAYEQAFKENPADDAAKAGLAQVKLLERLQDVDLASARAAAADNPANVEANLTVADVDLAGGHVEDAFNRIIDVVRRTKDDDREKARLRLLELFEVVGITDARVTKARRKLMAALF